MYDSGAKSSRGRQTSRPSREEKDVESRGTLAYSFPYINRYSNRATFRVTWVRGQPRHAAFWRACVPAEPSSDFFTPLRASGAVKRVFGAAACQRSRQASFWRRCVPAGPSSDFLASLTTQRRQRATWRRTKGGRCRASRPRSVP